MGLFHRYTTPGRGVTKEEAAASFGLRRFFSTFADKFWKIITLNLLFFLVNLPIFFYFASLAGVGGVPYSSPAGVLFQPLEGVLLHGQNPALQALGGVVGIQVLTAYPSVWTNLLSLVGALTLITFGLASAAMTYVQRNFVQARPTEVASDFFSCIKRNWKQSILLGLIDLLFVFVIAFDLVNYLYANQSFSMLLMLYATAVISILYLLMRPYLYLMSVTFDIKIPRMIKNSFLLATRAIGRNLLCGVVALAVLVLNVLVFAFLPSMGVAMLFIFTVSIAWFVQIYGAWPVVKKYMIDPYYEETPAESSQESVFEDRG